MLSLSRLPGERLILILPDGRRIVVEAVNVQRGRVTLGVEAPQDVRIFREELLERSPVSVES